MSPRTWNYSFRDFFRRRYALPAEHGSWIWWMGPLTIGVAAAGDLTLIILPLFIAALSAFLVRQPATVIVKTLSGRRHPRDRIPAIFWLVFYSAIALTAVGYLVMAGHERVVLLAIPGLPVFTWHLWLVSRRAERGQSGIEILGAGVLSLSAPAAYWVSGGDNDLLAWLLWILTWLQASASIVNVYMRLRQRLLKEPPSRNARWRMGYPTLLFNGINLIFSLGLSILQLTPMPVPVAYALMFADATEGVVHPAMGYQPTRIGLRQLGMSILFVLILILAFVVSG